MPEPPLLLADRVTGIDADARLDGHRHHLDRDRRPRGQLVPARRAACPPGIMIEAGQADLLLIRWLGVDFLNRGERVYRLLGCELTYHGGLAAPGRHARYEIHVDGHAKQGDVRLFFFHYDCRDRRRAPRSPCATARPASSPTRSSRAPAACSGTPRGRRHRDDGPLDPPAGRCAKRAVRPRPSSRAFAEGRRLRLLRPRLRATRRPTCARRASRRAACCSSIASTDFDPRGGPWGRGYLRAEHAGHARRLVLRRPLQERPLHARHADVRGLPAGDGVLPRGARATRSTATAGASSPSPSETYPMRCRGQVTPDARKQLVYEVFVEEVHDGPDAHASTPTCSCTVDGLKAFHARRVGLRLVPDWPLDTGAARPHATLDGAPAAAPLGGCGHVEPSRSRRSTASASTTRRCSPAPGASPPTRSARCTRRFDGTAPRRAPARAAVPLHDPRHADRRRRSAACKPGARVEVEYDVPPTPGTSSENGAAHDAVLRAARGRAAALRLARALRRQRAHRPTTDLLFRNLDGTGTCIAEVVPDARHAAHARRSSSSVSQSAGMIIEAFEVECFVGERRVYAMNTVFGFFPKAAFDEPGRPPRLRRGARPHRRAVDAAIDLDAAARALLRRRARACPARCC